MLRLIHSEHGSTGAIRRYQHDRLGVIETVTTWREPGAHIIHIVRPPKQSRKPGKVRRLRGRRAGARS